MAIASISPTSRYSLSSLETDLEPGAALTLTFRLALSHALCARRYYGAEETRDSRGVDVVHAAIGSLRRVRAPIHNFTSHMHTRIRIHIS